MRECNAKESGGKYAFAVKKGQNPELLQMFNEGLKELKRTGEYDKIINKYISTDNTPTKASKDESTLTGLLQNNYDSHFELYQYQVLILKSKELNKATANA